MSVTMKKLAYVAGVSRATVDRVLNKRGRVNAETEKRIWALAESMGYRPNLVAKTLSSPNKTMVIGCVLTFVDATFRMLMKSGIEANIKETEMFGIRTNIYLMDRFDLDQQYACIEALEAEGIQSLIISPINDERIAKKLQDLIDRGITVVCVTADIDLADCFAFVQSDHMRSGRICANLISLMTKDTARIAAFICSNKSLGHEQRVNGLRAAIAEKYPKLTLVCVEETRDDDYVTYAAVKRVFQTHADVNVMFFAGAGTLGGIRAIEESERNGEIHAVAYDLYAASAQSLANHGIVSAVLFQDPFNQGYTAAKVLTDYLLYSKIPAQKRIFTKPSIAVAESYDEYTIG